MADTRARIMIIGDSPGTSTSMGVGAQSFRFLKDSFPVKEFSILDDMLNVADAASVSVANPEGEHTGRFRLGQKITIDLGDDDVAGGTWVRMFTGRITRLSTYVDAHSGSNILINAMDLGWHLTSCDGHALLNLSGVTIGYLLNALIDPSWGFAPTEFANDRNTQVKQGRRGIVRALNPQLGARLPYIQVEPGQTPWDVLRVYAQREGVLLNIGADGQLILFRPDYRLSADYKVEFHGMSEAKRNQNNVIGTPTLDENIDGVYSEVQCFATVINQQLQNTDNPNSAYFSETFTPKKNPLPFKRRRVFSDNEAIDRDMAFTRAKWRYQLDAFNSWSYTVDFPTLAQNGFFFASNTLISVNDTINQVFGVHYVQSVNRSLTIGGGARSSGHRRCWVTRPMRCSSSPRNIRSHLRQPRPRSAPQREASAAPS